MFKVFFYGSRMITRLHGSNLFFIFWHQRFRCTYIVYQQECITVWLTFRLPSLVSATLLWKSYQKIEYFKSVKKVQVGRQVQVGTYRQVGIGRQVQVGRYRQVGIGRYTILQPVKKEASWTMIFPLSKQVKILCIIIGKHVRLYNLRGFTPLKISAQPDVGAR